MISILTAISCGPVCKEEPLDRTASSHPGVSGSPSSTQVDRPFSPKGDDLTFEEIETGSLFNLMGQSFDGDLEGTQLHRLPGMTAFWFAWSVHHPGARVWNNGENNAGEVIEASASTGVPCEEIQKACFGGKNCIPSINRPKWTNTSDTSALAYLTDDDRVLGLTDANGRARAYPLDTLWSHEIVNDTWDDWEFSVTYCPLTGSGLLVEGEQDGQSMRFGVSGMLYNANLVMYDRKTNSLYGQMRQMSTLR